MHPLIQKPPRLILVPVLILVLPLIPVLLLTHAHLLIPVLLTPVLEASKRGYTFLIRQIYAELTLVLR
jgi:hypothetical protein